MKSFSDLEQSKKLAEILPLESADMWWNFYSVTTDNTTPLIIHLDTPWVGNFNWDNKSDNVPCWSLAALLGVLPNKLQIVLAINNFQGDRKEKYAIGSVEHDKYDCYADNPVDACCEMILKLHELNLL